MRQFSIFLFALVMTFVVWNDAYACGGRGCGSYRGGSYRMGCSSGSCGITYQSNGGCANGTCGTYSPTIQPVAKPAPVPSAPVEVLKLKRAEMPSFSQESFE